MNDMYNGVSGSMKPLQVYGSENVLVAAQKRMELIFDTFKDIHVSVSGGKDSTVLAHLAITEAKRRNRKVSIFFLDEEAVYAETVRQVEYLMEQLAPEHVIPLWLQMEFNLTNATSLTETQFIPWEAGKHKLWLRPKKDYSIKFPPWDRSKEIVADKLKGLGFYDMFTNFERCYTNTAFLVGLRAVESPNRWRTVSKNPITIGGETTYWGTAKGENYSLYPLFDWNHFDIWKYIAEHNIRYHRIYDYQLKKGYGINEMRISSLIHERSFKSLVDLPEFEPETYNKLVKRAKGISLAQETAKNAQLFRATKLPKNFTSWRTYRDFLLETHPDQLIADVFRRRFTKHLDNEYVARQQVRKLILNDYENNLPVINKPDPRDAWVTYYKEVL